MNKRKQSIYLPTISMQDSDHRCGQQMNVVPSLSLSNATAFWRTAIQFLHVLSCKVSRSVRCFVGMNTYIKL